MIRDIDYVRQQWQSLLSHWHAGSQRADPHFANIVHLYEGPGRHYHTLDHVLEVLGTVARLAEHTTNLHAIQLAAWLHDVIYDSKKKDNEEQSADYARRLCDELSIPDGEVVAALILKTKSHDDGGDRDAQVLLDADLAILGSSETDYQAYADNIRLEYAWVPDADYRAGRRKVLQHFLDRPRIYHFLNELESPARRNVAAEIARLD